jgi:type IV secretory pathway TrbD component
MLPGLSGASKKQFFNEASDAIVLATGFCGAVLGLILFGWLGAVLGLGVGIVAGGSFAESQRFHRD